MEELRYKRTVKSVTRFHVGGAEEDIENLLNSISLNIKPSEIWVTHALDEWNNHIYTVFWIEQTDELI